MWGLTPAGAHVGLQKTKTCSVLTAMCAMMQMRGTNEELRKILNFSSPGTHSIRSASGEIRVTLVQVELCSGQCVRQAPPDADSSLRRRRLTVLDKP